MRTTTLKPRLCIVCCLKFLKNLIPYSIKSNLFQIVHLFFISLAIVTSISASFQSIKFVFLSFWYVIHTLEPLIMLCPYDNIGRVIEFFDRKRPEEAGVILNQNTVTLISRCNYQNAYIPCPLLARCLTTTNWQSSSECATVTSPIENRIQLGNKLSYLLLNTLSTSANS
jgi:hypothetical protein